MAASAAIKTKCVHNEYDLVIMIVFDHEQICDIEVKKVTSYTIKIKRALSFIHAHYIHSDNC